MVNGPELTAATLTDWCETYSIELVYIQPRKPRQNGLVMGLDDNEERKHVSLGNLPPAT